MAGYYNRGFGSTLFPPVIKMLFIVNIAVFFFEMLFLDIFTVGGKPLSAYFMRYFALQPFDWFSFLTPDEGIRFLPWQVVTYQFMHGGFWHIAFNLFALWMFGTELENLWGGKRFLSYYLLSGIGAGIAQLIVPYVIPGYASAPTVGASGAIYGILVAFAMTFPNRPIIMFPFFIPIPAKYFVMIFAVIEMISGVSGQDGVAHFAHLGGAMAGFLLMKYGESSGIFAKVEKLFGSLGNSPGSGFSGMGRKQKKENVFKVHWQTKKEEPQRSRYDKPDNYPPQQTKSRFSIDGEEISQEKIDSILDKISEKGYKNLSEREKYILNELSKRL